MHSSLRIRPGSAKRSVAEPPERPPELATSRMRSHTPARSFPVPAAARSAMGAPEEAAPAADVEAPPAPPPKPPAVPFREVLRTADTWDVVLMITGTICGAACGAVQPWCGARALPQSFRWRLSGASAAPRRRWPPRVSRRGTLASPAAGCGAAARSGAPRCAVARRTFEALRPTYLCTRPTVPLRPGRPTAARRAMLRDALRVAPPRAPEKATPSAVVTRPLCRFPRHSFTLIFGSLVDTLGSGTTMSESLRPVILWFCYLGGACPTRARASQVLRSSPLAFAHRSRCFGGRLPGDCVLGDGRHPPGQPHQARDAARSVPDSQRLHAYNLARCGSAP